MSEADFAGRVALVTGGADGMGAGGGGAIVNNASISGLVGCATLAPYSAAKHGVLGLTKCAALEYARQGIRVNAICPGYMDTGMTQQSTTTAMREALAESAPIGRLGGPGEAAEVATWLCPAPPAMSPAPASRWTAASPLHENCELKSMNASQARSVGLLLSYLALTLPGDARAQAAPERSPAEIYQTTCAACHEGAVPRAPHSVAFQMLGPRTILSALESGVMQSQGSTLSSSERRALAEYLAGAALPAAQTAARATCDAAHSKFDFNRPPPLAGWAMTLEGTRHVSSKSAGLRAADVSRLELKWAFAFPGATRARSQPTVGGGALFVGSQDGTIYALDFATGCIRFTFAADTEVRSSPVLEPWRRGDSAARPKLWFGDFKGNAYALDALSGALLWKTRVDEHPRLTITGSPRYFDGRLYVPMSSNEWAAAADPAYECCTFRGGITALDASNGTIVWRSYSIPQVPQATGETNKAGAARRHPAGAPVWNSPTIDAKRRRLYVGTGESYTSPAAAQSDSVIAYDLDTGRMLWWHQSIAGDAWNMACFIGGGPNCPVENGPDLDIGAPPILRRLPSGRDVLLVGQKSADIFALDPEDGRLLWKVKYGRGGFAGGVHWGMSLSPRTLYVPIADTTFLGTEKGEPKPGLFALEPGNGKIKWFVPAPDVCKAEQKPACDRGFSPPPTSMPGVVFQPSFDGWLRAYREADGQMLWSVNTARDFDTVSGEKAHGGSIESAGAIIADGRVMVNSGYLFGGRMPGNVLLVFSVDGK